MNADALVESKSLRESVIDRTDVLDKVKKLSLLPDNTNVSIEMTANYYEVHRDAIEKVIRANRSELNIDGLVVLKGEALSAFKAETGISISVGSFTIIPRRALLRIGMLLRDSAVAQMVRTYLLDSETEYRSHFDSPAMLHFQKEVYMLEATANILRLPESGKLKLMGDFNRQHGLQVPLPAYAHDEAHTESATVLLKKHGVRMGTAAFNTIMIQHGLLEEKEWPSSKGETKLFKSLTELGLKYGKNIISTANVRETQPHYYADRFGELLELISVGTA